MRKLIYFLLPLLPLTACSDRVKQVPEVQCEVNRSIETHNLKMALFWAVSKKADSVFSRSLDMYSKHVDTGNRKYLDSAIALANRWKGLCEASNTISDYKLPQK